MEVNQISLICKALADSSRLSIVLQLAQVLLGDGYVIQRTEARSNAIDGTADVIHLVVQVFPAFDDGTYRLFRERQFFMVVDDFFDSLQGEMGVGYGMHRV